MKWAILGGGLTGVTIGRLLFDRGHDVTILEQEPTIGGLCRSKNASGFTFDVGGSHIIFSRDDEVLHFMKNALGTNRDERKRNTKIYYKGRFVKYPFENGLHQLPKEDCFFCINEFIRTLIAVEKGELPPPKTFRDWIYHTFGKGIAELYMIPYNEKIWNYPTEQMSLHWVEGRIPRPPVEDIVRSAIGIETEGYTHQSIFSYPVAGGIESLVHAIAEPIKEFIHTDFAVKTIGREDGYFVIGNGREEFEAEGCISTIPLQALLPCLSTVPADVLNACAALKYNSLISVCIGIRGVVPSFSWLYVPQRDLGVFNRVSFPSNYSINVAPNGHSAILVEITYNEGDAISLMSDDEIRNHVIDGLMKMEILTDPASIAYTDVERQQYAYVVYDLEYQKNIDRIKNFCAERGIILLGRFSEFEYLNMDGCIRRALDLAERII